MHVRICRFIIRVRCAGGILFPGCHEVLCTRYLINRLWESH